MSRLPGDNFRKSFYFFELLPFANLDIGNLISQKPLQLGASNLVSLQRIRSRLPGENEKKDRFSHQKITDPYFLRPGLSLFVEFCPFLMVVMKSCNHGISKTILARSFKLAQLIDYLVKMKTNHFLIFELLPFANLDIDNLISQEPLQLGGSNLVSL